MKAHDLKHTTLLVYGGDIMMDRHVSAQIHLNAAKLTGWCLQYSQKNSEKDFGKGKKRSFLSQNSRLCSDLFCPSQWTNLKSIQHIEKLKPEKPTD